MTGNEGHYHSFTNMEHPASREQLFSMITEVMRETQPRQRAQKWREIHAMVHNQAVILPLWGKRIPTVLNDRLTGYEPGNQQFDYPVHRLQVVSGSTRVTIAPGAQTGIFRSVGRMDPHTYRPNEFFANNWIYEGLVQYGTEGQILPALARSWTIATNSKGGLSYTFQLRPNVRHRGIAMLQK